MSARMLAAGMAVAMAAVSVVTAVPAEAASPPKIVKVDHKSSIEVPESGVGVFDVTVKTSGTVKAVCVAIGYYSKSRTKPDKTVMVKAKKKAAGSWVLAHKYNLERKYTAFKVGIAADNDTNCVDTVSPGAKLRDKTMDARVGRTVNFWGRYQVKVGTSAKVVEKEQYVELTVTVSPTYFMGNDSLVWVYLQSHERSGVFKTIADVWCADYKACGYSVGNKPMKRKLKIRVTDTTCGEYRAWAEVNFKTAFAKRTIPFLSNSVTIGIA